MAYLTTLRDMNVLRLSWLRSMEIPVKLPTPTSRVLLPCLLYGDHRQQEYTILMKNWPNVQALHTMGKIKEINSYVWTTLDKLPGIRADLARFDDNCHDRAFPLMLEAFHKWCDRNPLHSSDQSNKSQDRFFNSSQEDYQQRLHLPHFNQPQVC